LIDKQFITSKLGYDVWEYYYLSNSVKYYLSIVICVLFSSANI